MSNAITLHWNGHRFSPFLEMKAPRQCYRERKDCPKTGCDCEDATEATTAHEPISATTPKND